MYSGGGGGGVGQKFPNDEKNFRIYHGILSHEGVCYSENEDAMDHLHYRLNFDLDKNFITA